MSAILYVIGGALLLRLRKPTAKYPHTMYDCVTGNEVVAETEEQHQLYADAGWVHSFDECPLDTPFGRDYGDFDYEDSVDDLNPQDQYEVVFEDSEVLDNVAVFRIQKLSYDPLRGRRGYYTTKGYVIGSTNLSPGGRPTSFNYDGDSIRMFSTMDAAIAYMKSIGKKRPTTPKKPEGDPMPDPTTPPTGEEDDTPTLPPTPVDPSPALPPMGGFGGYNDGMSYGGMPNTNFGGGY